jgi:hypothetical protein
MQHSRACLFVLLALAFSLSVLTPQPAEAAPLGEDDFVAFLASGSDLTVGEDALGLTPKPTAMSGCTATNLCIHGPSISCTGSTNTSCSSSGARCGQVTCDGQTTSCPGSCRPHLPIDCWSFCPSIGKEPVGCDEFGCCICS